MSDCGEYPQNLVKSIENTYKRFHLLNMAFRTGRDIEELEKELDERLKAMKEQDNKDIPL